MEVKSSLAHLSRDLLAFYKFEELDAREIKDTSNDYTAYFSTDPRELVEGKVMLPDALIRRWETLIILMARIMDVLYARPHLHVISR